MPSRLARRGTAIAVALALGGCASWIRTPYQRPPVQTPTQWEQQAAADTTALATSPWWEEFGDAALSRLVEAALRANADLAAATSRVRQAGLRAELAAGALRPTPAVTINAGYSRNDFGAARSSGVSGSIGYEVDLWGRLASARDAAQWEARAADEDRAGTALALQATVTRLYWQLASVNERLASAAESLAYAERTRALVRAQYGAGALSNLEVRQADAAVAGQLASQRVLERQRTEVRHALDLLFDTPPGLADGPVARQGEPQALPRTPLPEPDAGLPAALLARRPDVLAAENRLRATLAQGDAVRASYYPALTLSASLGTSSADLVRVLANPVATLGAGLALPFLRADDLRLDSALVREQYAEAAIGFRQTLYRAFGEVEDALSARRRLLEQAVHLDAQLSAAGDVERLFEIRYRAGAAPLQLWLDAQERRRAAQVAVTLNRFDRLVAQATLYQALGGTARR